MIARVVEDDELVLARRRAQAATDLLNEEDARLGRLGVYNATDIGVEARCKDADADKDLRCARSEPGEHVPARFAVRIGVVAVVSGWRFPVYVLSRNACFEEARAYILRVLPVDAEGYR